MGLKDVAVSQQPPPANASVEVMFQQIMHAVHKSVSSRVVSLFFHLDTR